MSKITLIIPMYNESGIITETANTLSNYMSANFSEYEILFSDDGSSDGCGDMVKELELPCVRVVGYEKNRGKGAAIRYAVGQADGDIVMFTDADLAYGTDVIKRVYDHFEANSRCELLIGSRNLTSEGYEGYTTVRRIMSKCYIKMLCIVGGFKFSDSQCGCKAFRGQAAKDIFGRCTVNGFAFDLEAILWAVELGMTVHELPVKIINHRESKVRIIRDSLKMFKDAYNIRKNVKKQSRLENKKRGMTNGI